MRIILALVAISDWWHLRRLRPGLLAAAELAERHAYSNKNTWALGPELNALHIAGLCRMMADGH